MSVSVFEHPWLGGLFGDPDIQQEWSADRQLTHLLAFERAFTEARAAVGAIDADAAAKALEVIEGYQANHPDLRAGVAQDGVVVPALVRQLRAGADTATQNAIHKGATSQDVTDTALALTIRSCTGILLQRLNDLLDRLTRLEADFGARTMMGRTRMQAALPISVGHRIGTWRRPLADHMVRLDKASTAAARLQLGGPVGDGSSLGGTAAATAEHMAQSLGLPVAQACWHADRGTLAEYSNTLCLITGSLGKIGQDICLMAQQGIAEVTLASGGGSSAMPHKCNPIRAELLVTLAQFNAGQQALMQQAMLHEQERSGTAWALEWMVLPQMNAATASALKSTLELTDSILSLGTAG